MLRFICYPKCTTCQKAQKWLDARSTAYELRDIKAENPIAAELTALRERIEKLEKLLEEK